MSLEHIPPEELASIVTWLEMRARPALRPTPASSLRLRRWPEPALDKYRALFRRVGTPWLWFSRLAMSDATLAAIVHDPRIEVFAVADMGGIEIGLLELDFRVAGECELAFFGLVPEVTGAGHGRWLMAEALGRAWRPGVTRVHVHTCSLDHPAALGFYRKQGFTPYRRAIERFADPRLLGLLARDAAPQIPLLGAAPAAAR